MNQVSKIEGVELFAKKSIKDNRGYFREWFSASDLAQVIGQEIRFEQGNFSLSKKGTVRGIHFSRSSQGQAKLVTCLTGKLWDVVVDLRRNSPTFGKWVAFEITPENGYSIFIPAGLGHGFQALEEDSTITYLLSSQYDPSTESTIHPFDENLAINWPMPATFVSERDMLAPSFLDFQN